MDTIIENINDSIYDIDNDNRDIEEEMIQQDIEEEEAQIIEEMEQKEQEQAEIKYLKSREVLNVKNLKLDLERKNESERKTYKWKKISDPTTIYTGIVIHQFDDDAFIFEINTESGKKLRKFRLSEIKQQLS